MCSDRWSGGRCLLLRGETRSSAQQQAALRSSRLRCAVGRAEGHERLPPSFPSLPFASLPLPLLSSPSLFLQVLLCARCCSTGWIEISVPCETSSFLEEEVRRNKISKMHRTVDRIRRYKGALVKLWQEDHRGFKARLNHTAGTHPGRVEPERWEGVRQRWGNGVRVSAGIVRRRLVGREL